MKKLISKLSQKNFWEIAGGLALIVVFVVPALSFAGGDKIYVDDDASGKKTGSSSHPYKTIGKALEEADEGDEVHVRAGTYKENITIPKDVNVFGAGSDKVIIDGDDNEEVVKMKHKSKIHDVTIKDGKYGIKIKSDSRASIVDCVIKDNDKDGIEIEGGKVDDKYMVSISNSEIKDNGRAGIYSEARRLVITENEIRDNGSDGVDIQGGSLVWFYKNSVKDNDGSGLKATLDGSEIWVKNNTFRDNDREGIEINAYGGYGRIDINKTKLYQNERNGIALVKRGNFSNSIFDGITLRDTNTFWENKLSAITGIISVF